MKALQIAGQIVIHRVAAEGFNKVSKGVKGPNEVGNNRGKVARKEIREMHQGLSGELSPALKIEKTNKLMQHARDWYELAPGHNATKNQITLLESLVKRIHRSPQIVKQGFWRGQLSDALFYSNGKHIIVTKSDGTFVSILKNAHKSNAWFKKAVIEKR